LLAVDADTGTIEAGKQADLVLVDGDPVADLSTLSRPLAVWQGGRSVSV
jgi:imidazolonepropionase-like amidohydrolase